MNALAERLKKNERAFMLLRKEERSYLKRHFINVEFLDGAACFSKKTGPIFNPAHVYRLKNSFGAPMEEQFFFPEGIDLFAPEKCNLVSAGCSIAYPVDAVGNNICPCVGVACEECICSLRNRATLIIYLNKAGGQRVTRAKTLAVPPTSRKEHILQKLNELIAIVTDG